MALALAHTSAVAAGASVGEPPETQASTQGSRLIPVASRSERADWLVQRAQCTSDHERAVINAKLAMDAVARAVNVHNAWLGRRVEATGLFPQSLKNEQFNYQNVAADFLCFEFAIAEYAQLASLPRVRDTFAREREWQQKARNPGAKGVDAVQLCKRLNAFTGAPIETSIADERFGTSEYLKDGLVGLYERTGDRQVLARLLELADAFERSCNVQAKCGTIASDNSEVNGNVLQVFSRLTFLVEHVEHADEKASGRFAELAARTAEAIITQMLPATGGVPVMVFDYASNAPFPSTDSRASAVQLRDHGNETFVGLSEAFAMCVARASTSSAARQRADRWAEPLAKMYELVLEHGVSDDGLIINRLEAGSFARRDARPCDTWGYLVMGALCFVDAAERHGVIDEARRGAIVKRCDEIAKAVIRTDGLIWQVNVNDRARQHHDGWADTIESAIYVAYRRPALREQLLGWCDRQIAYMFEVQTPDGFVSGDYLDGNFIRTAMLYAEARSGGVRIEPWAPGVGAGRAGEAVVIASTGAEYRGHATQRPNGATNSLHLPWDWPRLNSWPAWEGACVDWSGRVEAGASVPIGERGRSTGRD